MLLGLASGVRATFQQPFVRSKVEVNLRVFRVPVVDAQTAVLRG